MRFKLRWPKPKPGIMSSFFCPVHPHQVLSAEYHKNSRGAFCDLCTRAIFAFQKGSRDEDYYRNLWSKQ